MKKPILITALVLLATVSCNKQYRCLCSEPTGNGERTIDLSARNEDDAKTLCDAEEGEKYGYYFTCELE